MHDPITPKEPFAPESSQARSGCGKAAVFGCGGLLLVVLIAGIVLMVKIKDVTEWGFSVMEQQVMARLPPETTDEEARRIRQGFADVVEAVHEGRFDPVAIEQLQPVILRFSDGRKTPEPADVQRLIELLEAAAAGVPPGDAAGSEAAEPATSN